MTFQQLNYIIEIHNCGSINKAAQNLFVSQSSLSSAIREIEEELNIKIFNRSNRGITLTDDGNEFLTQIRPIIEQQKNVERFYKDRGSEERITFSISAQRYSFSAKAFIDLIKSKNVSKYEFTLKEMEMEKVIEDVSQRRSDIGVVFVSDLTSSFMKKVLSAKEMEFRAIKSIKPHAFFRKNHPLAKKEVLTIKDLIDYPYMMFAKKNNYTYNYAEEPVFTGNYDFKKIIYVNDRASAYNILAHTDACSTGSGILLEGYCIGELTSVPLESETKEMTLGWIKIKDTPDSELALEFVKLLEECI